MKSMPFTPDWDTIIIGGGAAGLSAALLLGRSRRKTLVIDSHTPRNRFAQDMHGVLGHEGSSPADLLSTGRREASSYGVHFASGHIQHVENIPNGLRVQLTHGETYEARTLIVASGVTDHLPDIPGLANGWGTTVLHCPYCHGWEVQDRHLGVLATSPASLHHAFLVRQWSDTITVFSAHLGPLDASTKNRLHARGITLVDSPVIDVTHHGDHTMTVRTSDGTTIKLDALFAAPTMTPNDAFLTPLSLDRTTTPHGGSLLKVDPVGKTSHPRIWAAGNVIAPMATVPVALGAGTLSAGAINSELVTEDFALAEETTHA